MSRNNVQPATANETTRMMSGRVAVIGSSGQIGALVTDQLVAQGMAVRAISRSTTQTRDDAGVEQKTIHAYTREELGRALAGCTHVISTLGLPYNARIWQREWPSMMDELLNACHMNSLPLTVLDNMYVYGRAASPITEDSNLAPCSRKGEARLEGWRRMHAFQQRGMDVVVCRAADFIGPGAETTILPWSGIAAVLHSGHGAVRWLGDPGFMHSFSSTVDIAGALVDVCARSEMRRHDVIHLPAVDAFSGHEFQDRLSRVAGRGITLHATPSSLVRLAGIFSGPAREQSEMMYQVERDYVVSDARYRELTPQSPHRSILGCLEQWAQMA